MPYLENPHPGPRESCLSTQTAKPLQRKPALKQRVHVLALRPRWGLRLCRQPSVLRPPLLQAASPPLTASAQSSPALYAHEPIATLISSRFGEKSWNSLNASPAPPLQTHLHHFPDGPVEKLFLFQADPLPSWISAVAVPSGTFLHQSPPRFACTLTPASVKHVLAAKPPGPLDTSLNRVTLFLTSAFSLSLHHLPTCILETRLSLPRPHFLIRSIIHPSRELCKNMPPARNSAGDT